MNLTLTMTDKLSGLQTYGPGPNRLPRVNCYLYLYSPSRRQYHYSNDLWLDSPPANGVAEGTLTMPRYSEMGTWSLNWLTCYDTANNYLQMNTSDAVSKHFPVNLTGIQPSETVDATVGSGGGIVQHTGSATSLTYPPGAAPDGTTIAIDVLSQKPRHPRR